MPDGTVSLPLIGTLQLVGKTVSAATTEITAACKWYLKNPRCRSPAFRRRRCTFTCRQRERARPVPDDPRFRPLEYLGRAGGPTTDADLSEVSLTTVAGVWVGTTKLDLSVRDPGGEGRGRLATVDAKSVNPVLNPGDTIWVGKAMSVSVVGEVTKPGAFEFREQRRLSEYVGLAGGPTPRADLGKTLLKHTKDGVTTSQKVDWDARRRIRRRRSWTWCSRPATC